MDFDRVYASDMKKMIKWFDVLQKNNIEIKLSEEELKKKSNKQPITKLNAEHSLK